MLEALAAAAVLGGGLLMLTSAAIQLTHDEKHVDWVNAAHALVQQKLEDLTTLGIGSLNVGTFNDATTLKANGTASGPFTRSWTVADNANPDLWGLRTVTVTVSWKDSLKGLHSTSAAAFVRCANIPCP
jgi:hypothetical protein